MTRTTLLVSLVVVLAATVVPAAAITTTGGPAADQAAADAAVPPGARLSGVVGVQNAELESQIEVRVFERRVETAATDAARAAVVADRLTATRDRLDALQNRLQALRTARANGSIGPGQFAARAAVLQARVNNVERVLARSETVARTLPADVLAAKGIDVNAIQRLQARAGNLTGPDVAAVARSIAGDRPGGSIDVPDPAGPPDDRGPPDDGTTDRRPDEAGGPDRPTTTNRTATGSDQSGAAGRTTTAGGTADEVTTDPAPSGDATPRDGSGDAGTTDPS
ncbi:MAG: hypothetical protein ABEJ08_00470 [Halobacteriaceae archaeon]